MKRILILIFVLFSYSKMEACRCLPSESLKFEFERTEIVVSGKVVGKEILDENYLLKVEFTIETIYKGTNIEKKIVIYSPKNTAACGYTEFEIGKDFIVFLSKKTQLPFSFKPDSGKDFFSGQHIALGHANTMKVYILKYASCWN